jgi:Na+-driven multidrug efflux pump
LCTDGADNKPPRAATMIHNDSPHRILCSTTLLLSNGHETHDDGSIGQIIISENLKNTGTSSCLHNVDHNRSHEERRSVWWEETLLLLQLAIPTVILQVGSMLPNVCAAAYVGQSLGAVYMSAFMLANNTANLFTLSLLWGLFTALDTLAPQAFGAGNFKHVGIIIVQGYIASMALVLPIVLLSAVYLADILIALGQDEVASQYAATWYRIFCLCLPCYSLYMVTWKFLSAQNSMFPLVVAAVFTNAVVLPCAMKFWTMHFGFAGSAAAVVTYHCCQPTVLLLYLYILKPYKTECWPGLFEACRAAVQSWKSFELFFYLGAGGILSSSECKRQVKGRACFEFFVSVGTIIT